MRALRFLAGRPFRWAVIAGAALAVAYPDLLPYVVAGVVLGLGADVLRRQPARAPRWRRRERARVRVSARLAVIAALGVLALVVAATALLSVGGGGIVHYDALAAPSVEIEGTSRVDIEYVPATDELRVERTLELTREQVAAAGAETGPTAAFETALIKELEGRGWRQSKLSNRTLAFTRSDAQPAKHHRLLPAEETNVVDVAVPSASVESPRGEHVIVDFRLTGTSEATVAAPHHAIGETFPASSSRQTRPRDKREFISLPIDDETAELEFEVRSPPFRNEVAASAVDLSGWTIFKWLVATALALSNEALRELIKKGWKAVTRRRALRVARSRA